MKYIMWTFVVMMLVVAAVITHISFTNADNFFRRGARMGAYSTMKKYEYCLLRAQSPDLTSLGVAERYVACTKIISEDVNAIWPKDEDDE